MKRIALALLGLTVALALAGCATINGENSFQSQAPQEVTVSQTATEPPQTTDAQQAQPAVTEPVQPAETETQDAAQPTPTPSAEPGAGGYNG